MRLFKLSPFSVAHEIHKCLLSTADFSLLSSISLIIFKKSMLANSLNLSSPACSPFFLNKSFASAKILINSRRDKTTLFSWVIKWGCSTNLKVSFSAKKSFTSSPLRVKVLLKLM
jgi:hypothetical protein